MKIFHFLVEIWCNFFHKEEWSWSMDEFNKVEGYCHVCKRVITHG